MVKAEDIRFTNCDIMDYKGFDFSKMTEEDWFKFAKANKTFKEPGVSEHELYAIYQGLMRKRAPITILETGQCFGTTTRFFLCYTMKYGGHLYSCELKKRQQFHDSMRELGLLDKFTTIEGDSMKVPWDKPIDFLFIDSEHALDDALGEYIRYRPFLKSDAIVGWHDTDFCPGVKAAVEIAHVLDRLEPICISTNKASAGVHIYKRIGRRTGEMLWGQQNLDVFKRLEKLGEVVNSASSVRKPK